MKKLGLHLTFLKNYGNGKTMSINWNQIKKEPLILHVLIIISGISIILMILTTYYGLKLPDLLNNNLDLICWTSFILWGVGSLIWESKLKK